MKIEYYKEHSTFLKRDMEFKIYGHAGKVFFVLPTQNNHFHEWEYRKMYDQVIDFIDKGECRFVSCEGIDLETWSNDNGGYPFRIDRHEEWIQYIIHELIPSARAKMGLGPDARFLATGASLGASHAANLFFRYPDVFDGCLCLSGAYDLSMYFAGFFNEKTYLNNPISYLPNMPLDHPYIQKYNACPMIFCVGQGAWEDICIPQLHELEDVLKSKGIHAWVDFWGYDVCHDWPWWRIQIRYFIDKILHE